MSNILFVYGTLRPGGKDIVLVNGQMYDLGWFPGVKLGGAEQFICEKIEVKDWKEVDHYEGYYPLDPADSLYIRRPLLDGFIYEFNRSVNPIKKVLSGDWLDYTKEERGINGKRF